MGNLGKKVEFGSEEIPVSVEGYWHLCFSLPIPGKEKEWIDATNKAADKLEQDRTLRRKRRKEPTNDE